jgi:hypothetical protein
MAESRIVLNLLRRIAADSGEVLVVVLTRTEDSAFLDTNAWNMLLLLLLLTVPLLMLLLVLCV